MAKKLFAFVILALLALENQQVHKQLHAAADPGLEWVDNMGKLVREQYQKFRQQQTVSAENGKQQQQQKSSEQLDYADYSDELEKLKQHFQHQRRRHQQQEQNYNRAAKQVNPSSSISPHLKSAPRVWQHMQHASKHSDEDSSMQSDDPDTVELAPLINDDDEGYVDLEHNDLADNDDLQRVNAHTRAPPKTGSTHHRCPKCERNQAVERISEDELRNLRIEFVKQQILQKLNLKEIPNVAAVGLPRPIYEGTTLELDEDEQEKNKNFDFYARTSKKFIFLERETVECKRFNNQPSMCFSIKIENATADSFDVNTAVLWLYKKPNNAKLNETTIAKQQIVISELGEQLDPNFLPIAKTIAIQSVDVQDEWMKIDIEWPTKRWFGNRDLSHLIQITCQFCEIASMDEMISVEKDYRPFIMVDMQNRRRLARPKRSINCSNTTTECCREKLYIDFAEIGWDKWIVRPKGYDAYFCRGSCHSLASVSQTSNHHATIIKRRSRIENEKPLELIPCCTAVQYSSLELMFMETSNTASKKIFPNMVVEACGCQ